MNDIVDRLKRVARRVRGTERDQDLSGMALDELAQHIERVRCGEAPLVEFCAAYDLPMPERRYFNVASGSTVIERMFIGDEEISVEPVCELPTRRPISEAPTDGTEILLWVPPTETPDRARYIQAERTWQVECSGGSGYVSDGLLREHGATWTSVKNITARRSDAAGGRHLGLEETER